MNAVSRMLARVPEVSGGFDRRILSVRAVPKRLTIEFACRYNDWLWGNIQPEGRAVRCKLPVLLIAFVAWQPSICASADDKPLHSVKGFGEFIDPDGDCKAKEDNGVVTIVVPMTYHDLSYKAESSKLNAPRILQDAKGDFRLEVEVQTFTLPQPNTSSGGEVSYVGSGLLVWQDDHNFIRMDRAAEGSSNVNPFIWVERFQDGKPASRQLHPIGDKDTFLRISRKGDKFTFEISQDGKEWTEVHSDEAKLSETLKAGVVAVNTTNIEFAPKLKGLKLTKGP